MKKRSVFAVLAVTAVSVGAMLAVDGIWKPQYFLKSLVKPIFFLIIPLITAGLVKDFQIKRLFAPNRKGMGTALLLGSIIYAIIVGGYFLINPFVDFSGIAGDLSRDVGVTAKNFLWVSLYISFVNSFLEEFFFRGFVYYGLKNVSDSKFAAIFSSIAFSVYHTAMLIGWFSIPMFLLVLLSLAVGGVIFILLNKRQGNIYTSWLAHMCANFAINTIGFILL